VTAAIERLAAGLAARASEGLARSRSVVSTPQGRAIVVDGRPLVSFASNDYLGLAADPRVAGALAAGVQAFGAGAGASHLLGGHQSPHAELEAALAALLRPCDGARALTLSSGYLANLAIMTTLADRDSEIFADRLNHACLNDGALLSRATFTRYRHLDVDGLRARLAASRAATRVIVTDAVFSMDGDVAPLAALAELADAHDAWLVVDDAHGFGVLGEGRGSLADAGVASARIVAMATLGKAAGVAGAFVAAHPTVIDAIVQTARPYIYTTAAPAALATAALASVAIIRDDAPRRAALFARIAQWSEGAGSLPWPRPASRTAIQPLVVGDARGASSLSAALRDAGVWAPAIRPPTVPAGTARLRISLSAAHAPDDGERLLAALRAAAPARATAARAMVGAGAQ
jgi:8-amino-7-oxononanoate synthase